jgi:hypothetical protein
MYLAQHPHQQHQVVQHQGALQAHLCHPLPHNGLLASLCLALPVGAGPVQLPRWVLQKGSQAPKDQTITSAVTGQFVNCMLLFPEKDRNLHPLLFVVTFPQLGCECFWVPVVFLVLLAWVMFLLVQFLLYIVFEIAFFIFDICLMFTSVAHCPVSSCSIFLTWLHHFWIQLGIHWSVYTAFCHHCFISETSLCLDCVGEGALQ